MNTKYKKRPVLIDAFQWTGGAEQRDDPEWAIEALQQGVIFFDLSGSAAVTLKIRTLEGEMTAQPGDWIIRGVKGELYPCKPNIFEATYDEAFETISPEAIAQMDAVLHPNGRCTCYGEGTCDWCKRTEANIAAMTPDERAFMDGGHEALLKIIADLRAKIAEAE